MRRCAHLLVDSLHVADALPVLLLQKFAKVHELLLQFQVLVLQHLQRAGGGLRLSTSAARLIASSRPAPAPAS